MTPERWQRIEGLVHDALACPATERDHFLRTACGQDTALQQEVATLVAAYEEADSFMEVPAAHAALVSPEDLPVRSWIGVRLGPYTLVEEIGHGGMSTVFAAVRSDQAYEQRVAIKLIRHGMEADHLRRRFRTERQILAALDHPHIARLHDGGSTDDGLPYLVMEHIEGTAIDAYCDQHRLGVEARLTLFRQVCSAVHHAHRNLVVHRDIKPANILVTADGVPKLLDFGIAKLLEPEAFPHTVEPTGTSLRPMTPTYASPEQVAGGAITTATDVYALGVLLHVLLCGALPYRFAARSHHAREEAILHAAPVPPSAALPVPPADAEVAARRATTARRLRRRLAGDLDTIVLMALRKDPQRRYGSVEQLAEDLRRHQDGLPVVARRETFGYRAGKLLRRHKLAAALVAAFVLSLAGFALAMALLAAQLAAERDRVGEERDRAERERATAQQVTGFFADLFRRADPHEAASSELTVRQALDHGAVRIGEELAGEPAVQAALLQTVGEVYTHLGLYDSAQPPIEEALRLRRQLFGAVHPDVATSLSSLGLVRQEQGDFAAAEALQQRALAIRRTTLGPEAPAVADSLERLVWFRNFAGDYEAAEEMVRRALAIHRQALGDDHPDVARDLFQLAVLRWNRRDLEGAEALHRQALAMARRHLGDEHPGVLSMRRELATVLREKGELAAAESLARQVLASERRRYGSDHPELLHTLDLLAITLDAKGDEREAEALYRQGLALRRAHFGAHHPAVAINLGNLGFLLNERGDFAAAADLHRESLAIGRHNLPPTSPHLAFPLMGLGGALLGLGRPAEAEPLLREALTLRRNALPAGGILVAEAELELARCLVAAGAYEEAETLLQHSAPLLTSGEGPQAQHRQQRVQQALADLEQARQR